MTPEAAMTRVTEITRSWMKGDTPASEAMLAIMLVAGTTETK